MPICIHSVTKTLGLYGLFRQSLNATGTRTNWLARYYVKLSHYNFTCTCTYSLAVDRSQSRPGWSSVWTSHQCSECSVLYCMVCLHLIFSYFLLMWLETSLMPFSMSGIIFAIIRSFAPSESECETFLWCLSFFSLKFFALARWDTVGQCAGGTHPTGTHSCFVWSFSL